MLAIAYREFTARQDQSSASRTKSELILLGYIAFFDPPKDTAGQGHLKPLHEPGVRVKILTGDNELVTRKVCQDVGLDDGPHGDRARNWPRLDRDEFARAVR